MPEYVRVKDDTTRHEYTTEKRFVVDGLTVIDKPAVHPNGTPLPPTYHVPLGETAPGSERDMRQRRTQKDSRAKGSGTEAGQTSAKKEN